MRVMACAYEKEARNRKGAAVPISTVGAMSLITRNSFTFLVRFNPFTPINSKMTRIIFNISGNFNTVDNRRDFCNLTKRICKENSFDNRYRLDKIILFTI